MIFPHTVKHNGKLYRPGDEVPIKIEQTEIVENNDTPEKDEPVVDMVTDDAVVQKEPLLEGREKELMALTQVELRQLASNLGVDVAKAATKPVIAQAIMDFEVNGLQVEEQVQAVTEEEEVISEVVASEGSLLDDIIQED